MCTAGFVGTDCGLSLLGLPLPEVVTAPSPPLSPPPPPPLPVGGSAGGGGDDAGGGLSGTTLWVVIGVAVGGGTIMLVIVMMIVYCSCSGPTVPPGKGSARPSAAADVAPSQLPPMHTVPPAITGGYPDFGIQYGGNPYQQYQQQYGNDYQFQQQQVAGWVPVPIQNDARVVTPSAVQLKSKK